MIYLNKKWKVSTILVCIAVLLSGWNTQQSYAQTIVDCTDIVSSNINISNNECTALEELDLYDDWFESVDVCSWQNIGCNDAQQITYLAITSTDRESLPDTFGDLLHLELLIITANRNLQTLPDTIKELKNVKAINIIANQSLKTLPSSMGELSQLSHIIIGANPELRTIPTSISQLNLIDLTITNNTSLGFISDVFAKENFPLIEIYEIDVPFFTPTNTVYLPIVINNADVENMVEIYDHPIPDDAALVAISSIGAGDFYEIQYQSYSTDLSKDELIQFYETILPTMGYTGTFELEPTILQNGDVEKAEYRGFFVNEQENIGYRIEIDVMVDSSISLYNPLRIAYAPIDQLRNPTLSMIPFADYITVDSEFIWEVNAHSTESYQIILDYFLLELPNFGYIPETPLVDLDGGYIGGFDAPNGDSFGVYITDMPEEGIVTIQIVQGISVSFKTN